MTSKGDLRTSLVEERPLEHDPAFCGVKLEDRSFRDVIGVILFLANLVMVSAISFYSFSKGELAGSSPECPDPSLANDFFGMAIVFLHQKSTLLAVSAGISLAWGLVWTVLLRMFTKIAIYFTLAVAVAIVIIGGIYLVTLNVDSEYIKIAGYVLFGVAALMVIVIFFLRKKIALTSAIMNEACKGLQHNPSSLLVTVLILGAAACFLAMWIASLIHLNCVPSLGKEDAHRLRYLFLLLIFGGLWIILFLLAALRCSVSGGIAVWYFSRGHYIHENAPMSPTLTSLRWAFTTSFGSLAIGSLLLAVIAFIRFVLYRAEKSAGQNKIAKIILNCMQCCCACLYGVVRQLNDFAYIYIAMYGEGFFSSAQRVFSLIGRNPLSTVMVESLTGLVLLFGRILGSVLSVMAVVAILKANYHDALSLPPNASSWVIVLSAVVSFVVISIFANVISCAVDAVFVCYCEDLERNRESGRYLADPDFNKCMQDAAKGQSASPPNKQ